MKDEYRMKRVNQLKENIKRLQGEINSIQSECAHLQVVYENGANTGNYDPSCDCYWRYVECLVCGKSMRFDSEDDYDNYRLVGIIGSEFQATRDEYKIWSELNGKFGGK